jgi:hypothetical protein
MAQGGGKHFRRYFRSWRKLTLRLRSTVPLHTISHGFDTNAGHNMRADMQFI